MHENVPYSTHIQHDYPSNQRSFTLTVTVTFALKVKVKKTKTMMMMTPILAVVGCVTCGSDVTYLLKTKPRPRLPCHQSKCDVAGIQHSM
mmetsp:Transcript_16237/g.45006  ORF Transcript_16237/g.45006 Transcript_16237/m.45006 type:complete len:90 (-) Transcript_16237:160-429(-)